MKPIRKAVFPVAGLGTRFLPATKAMPKEMLPVVDRPLIQHVVDEARAAGIEHFIFVTGRNKGVIEDHFDRQFELEHTLRERRGRPTSSALARDLPGPGTASFTRQQLPLGLGHAVWCAREMVGQEPFALLLPDVLVQHEPRLPRADDRRGARSRAARQHHRRRGSAAPSVFTCTAWSASASARASSFALTQMVEKPPREEAPSNLIITGRYILQPEIFDILASGKRGAGGEIQLTDAMIELAKTPAVLWPCSSPAAASTAAPRSASSPPMSPTRWRATTSRRRCAPSSSGCWGKAPLAVQGGAAPDYTIARPDGRAIVPSGLQPVARIAREDGRDALTERSVMRVPHRCSRRPISQTCAQ